MQLCHCQLAIGNPAIGKTPQHEIVSIKPPCNRVRPAGQMRSVGHVLPFFVWRCKTTIGIARMTT
jgi:hypothetical protein